MRIGTRVAPIVVTLLVGLGPASKACADWTPDGSPIAVYSCEEAPTSAVSDDRGGMIVVWMDNRNCTGNRIYAQRVLGSGTAAAGWPDGGLRVTTYESAQSYASVVSDGSGGAIVLWNDFRTGERALFAQRIAVDGSRLWPTEGVRLSPTPGEQAGGEVLADGAGGAFIAWMDTRRGLDDGLPHHHPLYDLYAQRLSPSGLRLWASEGVAVDANATVDGAPALVTDGAGGVHVTWQNADGATHLQHLRSGGSAALPANGVAIAGRFYGEQTSDGDGGIIAAFMFGPDTLEDLFAQRVDSSGVVVWPVDGVVVASAAFGQRPNAILSDGAGGAFIAWYDLRNGQNWDVYAQRINSSGARAAGWPANGLAVCTELGFQIYPRMIGDDAGGIVLAWSDARSASPVYDIYAQRIQGSGALAPGWPATGALVCGASGEQIGPIPIRDGSGGAILAWEDSRTYVDVYAQRVSGAGIVGETGSVIGVGEGVETGLALAAVAPNPVALGPMLVSFTAAAGTPASLSLVDARGRSMWTRGVEGASSGRVVVPAEELTHLPSGTYFLQLEQAGRSVSRKVSILR